MKKFSMLLIGVALFVAGYQHIRRQKEYINAQSALNNINPTSAEMPSSSSSVNLKKSVAFRLIKPS